jgi:fumarylacetoacetase
MNARTLAYGVVDGRVVVPLGDRLVDLARTLPPELAGVVAGPTLDPLLAAGPQVWADVRGALAERVEQDRVQEAPPGPPRLPFTVADYVDFYSSEQHATNVGRLFRPDGEPLPRAWKHLPIGYHGRSGTVAVSGTPVTRPHGLLGPGVFGPTAKLDFEAEVGFVVGVPAAGPVAPDDWRAHVFGVVLVNDWSARDIQAFETVPLGPFLGKSFLTSVSPWVVPLAALEDAFVEPPVQDPPPAAHLTPAGPGLALDLEVRLDGEVISRPPAAGLYWTAAQQLAHLTANGASLRTGDLYASGTVSGDRPDQLGCLLERTKNGTEPLGRRTFLEDGDTVTISATAGPVDLGAVSGTVVGRTPGSPRRTGGRP